MSDDGKHKNNVVKYRANNKQSSSGKNIKSKKQPSRRGKNNITHQMQLYLRKGYVAYRKMKTELKKNKDISRILNNRNLVSAGIGMGIFILVIIGVWFFTHKNSYEVFLGEKSIGIISMNKNVSQQVLQDAAVTMLSTQLGSNVQVNEQVTFTAVHSSKGKRSSVDFTISEICKNFSYKVEACSISIDGIEISILKSQSEADDVLAGIRKIYIPDGAIIVESESGFMEKVDTSRKYVDPSEIESKELAYSKLTAQNTVEQQYITKSGDSLWSIASKNGMSTDDLVQLNPEISDPSKLKVGQTLKVLKPVPILSVKVVVEEKYTEVDKKKEQQVENPEQPTNYKKVIQTGKDGQKEVTYHITRVNGFEIKKESISEHTITPSEPYIIEVGTKK